MGVHPVQEKRIWHDPWAGIDAVSRDIPGHPYARLNRKDIQDAFEELLSFLNSTGIPYYRLPYYRHPVMQASLITS